MRAATSDSARNLSAQTGANTAITALSELVLANFSAVFRLMKPKPYESSNMPTTTPPAPVHREGKPHVDHQTGSVPPDDYECQHHSRVDDLHKFGVSGHIRR